MSDDDAFNLGDLKYDGNQGVNVGGTTIPMSWLPPDQQAQAALSATAPPPPPTQPTSAAGGQLLNYGIGAPLPASGDQTAQTAIPLPNPLPGGAGNFPYQPKTGMQLQQPMAPAPPANVGFGPQAVSGAQAAAAGPAPFVPPKETGGGGASSPGYGATEQQAFNKAQEAAQLQAENETALGTAKAKLGQQEAARLATQGQQQQAVANETAKNSGQSLAMEKQATIDFLNSKIDPNRFWANKSTGDKVFAVLAQALGGFAAGYTHTDNQVAKTYQQLVDRDIETQKANIEQKGKAAGMFGELVKQYQAAGLSQQEAIDRASQTFKEKFALESTNLANQMAGETGKQHWLATQAENFKDLATTRSKLDAERAATTASQSAAANAALQRREGEYQFAKEKYIDKTYGVANPLQNKDLFVPGVAGAPGQYAPNKELAQKAIDAHAGLDPAISAVSNLVNWTRANGNTALDRKTVNEGKAMANNAKALVMNSDDIKRLSPESQKFFEQMIPDDPTSFLQVLPQLQATLQQLHDKRDTLDQGFGIRPTNQYIPEKPAR